MKNNWLNLILGLCILTQGIVSYHQSKRISDLRQSISELKVRVIKLDRHVEYERQLWRTVVEELSDKDSKIEITQEELFDKVWAAAMPIRKTKEN